MKIRRTLKKVLSFILVLSMVMSLVNITVFAVDAPETDVPEEALLTCGLEEHTHTDECYAHDLTAAPICGQEESEGHQHTDACYGEPVKTLVCELEESEGHVHTEECEPETVKTLVCGKAESEGHAHTEECFETKQVLTCEIPENHTHTIDCYLTDENFGEVMEFDGQYYNVVRLTCEIPEGHTHTDACYTEVTEQVCGQEESEAHTHTDECYVEETVYHCGKEAAEGHTHTDECYKDIAPLVCELEESEGHTHTDACYPLTDELVCGKEEHTHTEECYELPMGAAIGGGTLTVDISGFPEGSTVTVMDTDHTITVNGDWRGQLVFNHTGTARIIGSGKIIADKKGSAIVVKSGTVILETGVTVTGGIGTEVSGTGLEVYSTDYQGLGRNGGKFRAGGGVYVAGGTFQLAGGTVTGNTAQRGGGIFVNKGASFTMTGGTVSNNETVGISEWNSGNYNLAGEGGGIYVWGKATISGGSITGNTCNSETDLGGGGIYINNGGIATLINAKITGNTAYGFGGGIAGCCHGEMSLVAIDGVAMYDNTAKGTNHTLPKYWPNISDYMKGKRDNTAETTDHWNAAHDQGFTASHTKDFYTAGATIVSNYMAGGGSARYSAKVGSAKVVEIKDEQVLKYVDNVGLVANPTQDSKNMFPGGVVISGNTSKVHGGGIGCNGGLYFGSHKDNEIELDTIDLTLNASKSITGREIKENEFLFGLYLEDGTTKVAEARNDKNGNITFKINNSTDNIGKDWVTSKKVTFIMKELSGNSSDTKADPSQYKFEVTLSKELYKTETVVLDHTTDGNEAFNTIKVTYSSYIFKKLSETITKIVDANGNSVSENVTGGVKFVNEHKTSSLSITKEVTGNIDPDIYSNHEFKFTVTGPTNYPGLIAPKTYYPVTVKGGATVTLTDLPVGTYTVTEDTDTAKITGFNWTGTKTSGSVTVSTNGTATFTATNNYTIKYVDLAVVKQWPADKTGDILPASVTVAVQRSTDGTNYETIATADLTAANGWSAEWDHSVTSWTAADLTTGKLYTYRIVETGVTYNENSYYNSERVGTSNLYKVWTDDAKYNVESNTYELFGGWQSSETTTTTDGSTVQVYATISNTWIPAEDIGTASFTIHKVAEVNDARLDYNEVNLAGAEFTLYKGTDTTEVVNTTITDEYGNGGFAGLKKGTYTLKETKAPVGYDLDKTVWTIVVSEDEFQKSTVTARENGYDLQNEWTWKAQTGDNIGTLKVVNTIKRYNITLSKEVLFDTRGDEFMNNCKLVEDLTFTFHVHDEAINGQVIDTTVTLKADKWTETLSNLPYGTITISEINIPEVPYFDFGSVKMESAVGTWANGTLTITGEQLDAAADRAVTVTAKNYYEIHRVSLELDKIVTLDGKAPTERNNYVVNGQTFEFNVRGVPADGSPIFDEQVTLTVDATGNAEAKTLTDLPVGLYIITETKNDSLSDYNFKGVTFAVTKGGDVVPANATGTQVSFDLTEETDGATISVAATNDYTVKTGDIVIHKDASMDGTLYGEEGEHIVEKFHFFLDGTDLNGKEVHKDLWVKYSDEATFKDIPYGDYVITEDMEAAGVEHYDFGGVRFHNAADGSNTSNDKYFDQNEVGKEDWGFNVKLDDAHDSASVELKLDVTNEYTRKLDKMTVTKIISGNNMDYSSKYDFTVAFKSPADYVKLAGSYNYTVVDAQGNEVEGKGGTISPVFVPDTDTFETDDGNQHFESAAGHTQTVEVNGEVYTVYGTIEGLGNGEKAVVTGLPVGVKWHVTEVKENEGYYTSYENQNGTVAENAANAATVNNSNTINTTVNVQKVWVGDDENRRPTSITVQLYKDGNPVEGETKVLDASNNWSASWTGLTYGSTYDVVEVGNYPGYTASRTGSGRGTTVNITITNTFDEESLDHDLSVSKVWEGGDPLTRPTEIQVQLYRGEETIGGPVTLSASQGWTYTWTGLKGDPEEYTIEELSEFEDYEPMVTNDGWTFTVYNTYTGNPLTPMLNVQKIWVGDDEFVRPTEIQVQVLRDGEVDEVVTLNAENGWSWSRQLTLDELDSTFEVKELNVPADYTVSIEEGNNGLSFTIYNTYDIPDFDIPDDDVPLDDFPDIDIPDDDVPLDDAPQTGDQSHLALWIGLAVCSAFGMALCSTDLFAADSKKNRKK